MNKLKSSEEIVSMFLGLVIVAVVVGLIFNFFQKRRGTVSLSGVSDQNNIEVSIDDTVKVDQSSRYEVNSGDSLWKIAESKLGDGHRWTEIAKLNNLKNPGMLEKGQKLVLPLIEKIDNNMASKIEGSNYKVTLGDSLWKISVRAYGDGFQWVKVWQQNQKILTSPDMLEVGMNLEIPR